MELEDELNEPGPSRQQWRSGGFSFDTIPEPAAQRLFFYLRYDEIRNLQDTIRSGRFDDMVAYGEVLLETRLRKSSNFIWQRFCEEKKEEDRMAPRVCHAMIYHPGDRSVYIFGGRTTRNGGLDEEGMPRVYDEEYNACFNDLWKLDMATMTCSRICVTTTPYPLPKCGSSMVIYNEEIILFGGRRPLPPRQSRMVQNPNTNEIHVFNPKASSWRKLVPHNESPSLFGHSAVVCDDLLITFGGTLDLYTLNTTFRVLDLKKQRWFNPPLPGVPGVFVVNGPERVSTEFPIYGAESSSLIALKPGHLLLLGEGRPPSRRHVAVVVSYDPENPQGKWTWRTVPAIGKWFEGFKRPAGPSRHKNSDFGKVVALYGEGFVRLATVGLPSSYFQRERARLENNLTPDVDPDEVEVFIDGRTGRHALYGLGLIRAIQSELDSAWRNNKDNPITFENSEMDDFSFIRSGVHVEIKNLFMAFRLIRRGAEPVKTTVKVRRERDANGEATSLDNAWLISLTRRTVDFCFAYYSRELIMMKKTPRCDRRFRQALRTARPNPPVDILQPMPHLVSYSALIPLGPDWKPEDITEIRYEEGQSHFFCPPILHDFAICATQAEVVIHGGELQKERIPQAVYLMMPSGGRTNPNLPSTSHQ